jgi:hypothetical protein
MDHPSVTPNIKPLRVEFRGNLWTTFARIVFWGVLFAAWIGAASLFPAYGVLAILLLAPTAALLTFAERRAGLRPVAARTFAIVLTGLISLSAGVAAVGEYQSNECRPGLSYPCSDTHWEIVWALVCFSAAALVALQVVAWIRAFKP